MDIEILLFLQNLRETLGRGWTVFFEKMTFLGEPQIVIFAAVTIYWCIEKSVGIYLFIGWSWNLLLNGFLKVTACVYRPWVRDTRISPNPKSLKTATGYSFPSGHSTNVGVAFGSFFINKNNKMVLRIIALVLLCLVAFSRIFLGVHTPQDIVVGAVLSTVVMYFTKIAIDYMKKDDSNDLKVAGISFLFILAIVVYARF